MKKILAIICSAALALSLCNGVFADDNLVLAADAELIVDSESTEYPENVASNAIDGDTATRWQSAKKGNDGEDAWIGAKWTEAKTIGTIYIHWETAHPAEGGFKVQISDDGETWNDTAFTAARTDTADKNNQKDTITLTDVPTTKYVRVLCQTAYVDGDGNVKEKPSAYEFAVYAGEPVGDDNSGDNSGDDNSGADTGVASTMAFAVVAMAAAAVAVKSKKNG